MAYTSKKKSVYINFVTPIGIARFPKIDAPDTTGQYADNKYKTELVLDDADTKAFKKVLQDAVKQLLPNEKNVRIPIKTSKKDGVVSFIFKSHKKPVIVDAARNRVPEGVAIGPGSRIRISGSLTDYESRGDYGITAYFDACQVIELRERHDATKAFDAVEDGFKATDVAPEAAFSDNASSQGGVLDL